MQSLCQITLGETLTDLVSDFAQTYALHNKTCDDIAIVHDSTVQDNCSTQLPVSRCQICVLPSLYSVATLAKLPGYVCGCICGLGYVCLPACLTWSHRSRSRRCHASVALEKFSVVLHTPVMIVFAWTSRRITRQHISGVRTNIHVYVRTRTRTQPGIQSPLPRVEHARVTGGTEDHKSRRKRWDHARGQ